MSPQKLHKDQELRSYSLDVELRAAQDSRTIEGYAAIYESPTDIGPFDEVIAKGAFANADISDVRALFNHDPSAILARTKSGTLSLTKDEKGLHFRFDAPNTTAGNDLIESVRRGDVNQASFAFVIDKDTWAKRDGGRELRIIQKIKTVYDISAVTYPAYEDTDVALRSKAAHDEIVVEDQVLLDKDKNQWLSELRDGLNFLNRGAAAK
ncbi:MAG: HK97 family phage prohead protease [Bacteroidota bacterium]